MKRLISLSILGAFIGLGISGAVIAQTRQTVAEARADHNEAVCLAAMLDKGCTQAQVDAAPITPTAKGTIYSTDAAFRDGVLLPQTLDARTQARINRIYEHINRVIQTLTPAERVAVCTAIPRAKLPDPEVCR